MWYILPMRLAELSSLRVGRDHPRITLTCEFSFLWQGTMSMFGQGFYLVTINVVACDVARATPLGSPTILFLVFLPILI